MRYWIAVAVIIALPDLSAAHHSRAEYLEEIEITGTLVDILWRNPHPGFTVEVENEEGTTRWTVEGWSSLYTFDRAGITQDRFSIGDTLSVAGLASVRRSDRLLGTHILLADGTQAILRRESEPYSAWSSPENIGGHANWANETQTAVVNASEENQSFFRVWSYPSPNMQTVTHLPLTDAAQAARSNFDQVNNYIMRCESKGMPASMTTPNPYEFINNGETITIRGYEGDVVRTVYMGVPPHAGDIPPSAQGFSLGRLLENTLVIYTNRIDFPILGMTGIPLSERLSVVERYTLSDDQTRLNFRITATDPETFTEEASWEFYWLALGETFGQYACDVH
jgi:hypothetical protein